jgi:hypothetical protein
MRSLTWLVVVISGTAGCTYIGNAAKQAEYSSQMRSAPTIKTYKHMLEAENFFVFGKLENEVNINWAAVAVVALTDRLQKNEVVEVCNFSRIGSYYGLNLPAGDFRLLVVSDLNRDGFYDENEVIGERELSLSSQAFPDQVLGDFNLDLKAPFISEPGTSFRLAVRKPTEKAESFFYPRGTIRSLNDEIFSHEMSSLGLYEPAAFMEEAPMMFYALEEDAGYKVPVVFVHGIDGTPRDFSEILAHLDRTQYKPWFFYYPSGTDLSRLSELFYKIFLSGKVIPLQYMPMVIVAHSMGGLVIRDAMNRYAGNVEETKVKRLITIASPMGGHPDARKGADGPVPIPSWRDIAPDSTFIRSLHRKNLPGALEYYLIYAYGNPSTIKLGENSDGVVPLWSQLRREAQNEAKAQYGFNDSHTAILEDPEAVLRINRLIEEVKSPFPEAHLKELQKGGFSVDLGKEFSPLESHIIRSIGLWLEALAAGTITPFDSAQEHFIKVYKGEISPENESETAWLKFVRKFPDRSGLKWNGAEK